MPYLYGRYVERFLRLRLAVDGSDAHALERLDGETRALRDRDRRAASVAVVDVAMGLPMRGELGFARGFDDAWRGDRDLFLHLLEALRSGCPAGPEPGPARRAAATRSRAEPPVRSISVPAPAAGAAPGGEAAPRGGARSPR